jgi:hypothetical protein
MMLSTEEILEGLRQTSTPDECFFNVWQEGEFDGTAAWILPMILHEQQYSIIIPHARLQQLSSVAEVTVAVDDTIEALVEKILIQTQANAVLRRGNN